MDYLEDHLMKLNDFSKRILDSIVQHEDNQEPQQVGHIPSPDVRETSAVPQAQS